ncbi:SGNH/GDSL hydrolase family protein, partial [Burkholderia ubonensis]|uniref:SGNH/GDSL hydrolase family protein n=1 Tax=Burkholderia ubonensis TaxID=101571 RepID=UPI00210EBCD0
ADLQAQFGDGVTVVANSRSGATLKNMLEGSGFMQTYAQYLAADDSKIVIENFSLNDENQYSAADFRQYLVTFISLTQQAGKIPVLEEPNQGCNPATGKQWPGQDGQPVFDTFVLMIDEVAQAYDVALVKQYRQLRDMPDLCSMLSDGGIHPNSALYAIKAQNEAVVLAPIIKKLAGN